MKYYLKNLIFGMLAGVFFVYVCTLTLGYTAAIVMPQWYLELMQGSTARAAWFFVWDFFAVQLLGAGILCFMLVYLFVKLFNLHRLLFPFVFFITHLLFIYVVDIHSMRLLNLDFEFTLYWLMHPLAVITTIVLAIMTSWHPIKKSTGNQGI